MIDEVNKSGVSRDEELEFLNFIEQYWYIYGTCPGPSRLKELGVRGELAAKFEDPGFRELCLERGITPPPLATKAGSPTDPLWKQWTLTELQLVVINTVLDTVDSRSVRKKLQDAGIATQTWQAWLRDPKVQNYLKQRGENLIVDSAHEAHLSLVDRVKGGDLGSIKYFNELTGRYTEAGDSLDVLTLLVKVIEIVQKNVSDTEIQAAIAADFDKLTRQTLNNPQGLPVGSYAEELIEEAEIEEETGS